MVIPDGASEKAGLGDELGSEEDLLYDDFRSSGHRFGHPGGGGGEQLAINEVGNMELCIYSLYLQRMDFTRIIVQFTTLCLGISRITSKM